MTSPLSAEQCASTTLRESGSEIKATLSNGWLELQQGEETVALSPIQTNQLREWLRLVRHNT